MSATSESITLAQFSAAITELPLSSLFAKGAEIRNSKHHLERSNTELKSYADAGDRDCVDAIEENVGVIAKMQMRLELLMLEVERRGFNWNEARGVVSDQEPVHADSAIEQWDPDATTLVDSAVQQRDWETRTLADQSDEHLQQTRDPTTTSARLGERLPTQGRRLEDVQPTPPGEQDDHSTERNGIHL